MYSHSTYIVSPSTGFLTVCLVSYICSATDCLSTVRLELLWLICVLINIHQPRKLYVSLLQHDNYYSARVLFSPACMYLQLWRTFYTVVMMVLAFASLFAQAHSQFLSSHWYMRRLVLYSAFFFAGIVPVIHWVLHNGGFSDPQVQVSVCVLVELYILYL